jgi:glycosyltransferase involved in cell wall biosynthesis|tara:strand:+ start:612 stop:1874 length:1263 start_codon:yes stop_codon:yes gene_type:complete
MKELLVFQGPLSSRSGYGDHARDLVRALISMDRFDIKIIDLRWGDCPRNALTTRDVDIASRIVTGNIDRQPDVFVQLSVPNEFNPVGKFNIGITAGIETTICSAQWLEGLNRMDLNIVPSQHSKDVFEKTFYDRMDNRTKQKVGELKCEKPIEVLFEGADLNIWKKTDEISETVHTDLSTIPESFCFLHVGHWLQGVEGESRKDTGGMIRTFCNTFKTGTKKPALILKTSSATFSVIDRENTLSKIRDIRNQIPNAPNVYLVHGDMTPTELNSLYNHPKVKAHISFTKGEGFGRPLLEASLSGKPVIASNWSGHIDFLKHSILLPGELKPVHPSVHWKDVILPEAKWFTINYNYASKVLKEVFKKYKDFIPSARKQRRHSIDNFSIDKMNSDFKTMVEKYIPKTEQVEIKLPTLPKLERV